MLTVVVLPTCRQTLPSVETKLLSEFPARTTRVQ
jgi:hypothetical protein